MGAILLVAYCSLALLFHQWPASRGLQCREKEGSFQNKNSKLKRHGVRTMITIIFNPTTIRIEADFEVTSPEAWKQRFSSLWLRSPCLFKIPTNERTHRANMLEACLKLVWMVWCKTTLPGCPDISANISLVQRYWTGPPWDETSSHSKRFGKMWELWESVSVKSSGRTLCGVIFIVVNFMRVSVMEFWVSDHSVFLLVWVSSSCGWRASVMTRGASTLLQSGQRWVGGAESENLYVD